MLIQKQPAQGDIVSLRLNSGEEVIGRFDASTITSVSMLRPVILVTQMVSENQASMGLMPFMGSLDESQTVDISRGAIAAGPVATKADVANVYRNATSSIAVPKKTLIT